MKEVRSYYPSTKMQDKMSIKNNIMAFIMAFIILENRVSDT
jgi:hypothetical protein